jgi:hypothetical protein
VPAPSGDQRVFSEIDVEIRTSVGDTFDPNVATDPPLTTNGGAYVWINDGTSEGRVPGLRVFADGTEIEESGSAAAPPTFSFQYNRSDAVHGQPVDLEFRYQGASVTLRTEPLVVELTSPLAEQTVPADQELVIRWSGVRSAPTELLLSPTDPCTVALERVAIGETEAVFAPVSDPQGNDPPCRFNLTASWSSGQMPSLSPAPFRSLVLEGGTRRIVAFTIR